MQKLIAFAFASATSSDGPVDAPVRTPILMVLRAVRCLGCRRNSRRYIPWRASRREAAKRNRLPVSDLGGRPSALEMANPLNSRQLLFDQ